MIAVLLLVLLWGLYLSTLAEPPAGYVTADAPSPSPYSHSLKES